MAFGAIERVRRSRWAMLFAIVLVILIVGHLLIGTDPFVLATSLAVMGVSLLPMWRFGALNLASMLVVITAFRYVGGPLLAKLLLGQPLQSNLHQPLPSFIVVLVGIAGYAMAAFIANSITIRRSWLPRIESVAHLRRFAAVGAVLGFAAVAIAGRSLGDSAAADSSGGALISFFGGFINLALVAATAAAMRRSGGRRGWDAWVVVIGGTFAMLSMAFNSRSALMGAFIAYVVSIFGYRGYLRFSQTAIIVGAVLLMILVVTPLTLYVRGQVYGASLSQRAAIVVDAIKNWDKVTAAYDAFNSGHDTPQLYLNYYGGPQNTLERMSHINHTDVIKDAADKGQMLGWQDLKESLDRTLPTAIASDKHSDYSSGDLFYCKLHVACGYGNRASLPLIAAGYGAFGWSGAFFYPLLLATPFFLLLNKLGGPSIRENMWALYFFVDAQWGFAEGGSDYYMLALLRYIPEYMIVFGILTIITGTGRVKLFRARSSHRLISRPPVGQELAAKFQGSSEPS